MTTQSSRAIDNPNDELVNADFVEEASLQLNPVVEALLQRVRLKARCRIAWLRKLWKEEGETNSQGLLVSHAEVEAVLYGHHAVKECAVVGKPDALAGEIPKAYVVLRDEHTAGREELIEFCAGRIAPYKRIREVEFIEQIPKTPVGKMLRRVLRDRERAGQP